MDSILVQKREGDFFFLHIQIKSKQASPSKNNTEELSGRLFFSPVIHGI